ncbi:MAG: hypothetical protein IPM82_12645 [Saprospiraceae bacterium]|nr:hypothetical protein [Saprospiraceae bacterium]
MSNLSEEKAKLANQQQGLQKMIAAREAAIQNMSAAQIKQQVLFSEQSRMLDSMQFAGAMDSMNLAQKEVVVQQQQAELQQKQAEIELQSSQRNLLLAIVGLVLFLVALCSFDTRPSATTTSCFQKKTESSRKNAGARRNCCSTFCPPASPMS